MSMAVIATGFVRKQFGGPAPSGRWLFPGVCFLFEAVVVDDVGFRHYDLTKGIRRLEWRQIQEIAAGSVSSGFGVYYGARIRATNEGDVGSLWITRGREGVSRLLDGLAPLPNFPRDDFLSALRESDYDEEVVVWRRP